SWLAVMDGIGRAVYAGLGAIQEGLGRVRIFLEGRRAKQQRHERQELVTKARAKPKPKPKIVPRIEPTIGKGEKSARVERERQVPLFEPIAAGELPPLSLLDAPPPREGGYSAEAHEKTSRPADLKPADCRV